MLVLDHLHIRHGNGGVYSYFNTDMVKKQVPVVPVVVYQVIQWEPQEPAAALGGNGGGASSNANATRPGAAGDSASPDPLVFGGNSGGASTTANAGAGGNTGGGGGGVGGNGGNARAPDRSIPMVMVAVRVVLVRSTSTDVPIIIHERI